LKSNCQTFDDLCFSKTNLGKDFLYLVATIGILKLSESFQRGCLFKDLLFSSKGIIAHKFGASDFKSMKFISSLMQDFIL